MATQFTVYSSTDASAPVLSGQAGALTTLLDAVLVNGYGAKAAAGWTIQYTATNRRVYKQGAGSSGAYFRVRDDAGGTGGAKEALVVGGEVWSDVNTCTTNPFPSPAQITSIDNSLVIRKSTTADATARAWKIFADAKTCYIFISTGDISTGLYSSMLGDIYGFDSRDVYRAAIIASATSGAGNTNSALAYCNPGYQLSVLTGLTGHFLQRGQAGLLLSCPFSKVPAVSFSTYGIGANSSGGYLTFPNPVGGGLQITRIYANEFNNSVVGIRSMRGWMRGLYSSVYPTSSQISYPFASPAWTFPAAYPAQALSDGLVITGTGNLSGRTFMVVANLQNTSTAATVVNDAYLLIETSNTVE